MENVLSEEFRKQGLILFWLLKFKLILIFLFIYLCLYFYKFETNLFVLLGQTLFINNNLLLGGIVVQNFAASVFGYMSDVLKKPHLKVYAHKNIFYWLLMMENLVIVIKTLMCFYILKFKWK